MKKFTIIALTAMVLAGTASAKVRWNPENAWATDNGKTILPMSEDKKCSVNKLVKGDGQWRADIRYAQEALFTEDEPYLVVQITTDGCAWNLNDYKFEFMLQRKLSEGLNEDGSVKWGGNTTSFDENYPSFDGSKYKIVDQYEAELFQSLGSKVANTDGEVVYTEDIIVLDLNKVKATDEDKTQGLLFSAGDVKFPNYNAFQNIVEPDANGMGGVQQRSWLGFVCIAKDVTVTSDQPTFTIHYTGTVADSNDALTVCDDYANGEGGQEVRPDDDSKVSNLISEEKNLNVYLHNGRSVVCEGADLNVYTADGKMVKAGFNEVELESGLYIVKATKKGMSKTVKALVK